MIRIAAIFLISIYLMAGCREKDPMPKPRAYPRVEFPERHYVTYDSATCPFTFEYPDFAQIRNKDEDCWFDLFIPSLSARIHCSYLPVKDRADFDDLVQDAFVIAARINERASYMEETRLKNAQGVNGLILEWTGPAASPVHFFLTDSTHHFFKAALYFDSKVQPDSLAPVAAFIREDIQQMINTFSWK